MVLSLPSSRNSVEEIIDLQYQSSLIEKAIFNLGHNG